MSPAEKQPPRFFATAAKGTEPLLRDELRELRLPRVRAARGGVHFGATARDAYRACLWSRIALRILEPVAEFDCPHEDALYEGVQRFDFTRLLDARRTLLVRAACRSSRLTHTQYIAQRSKDAIVDQLRDRLGARPSVARDEPDLLLFVHLVNDRATVYLDYGGESLHQHGFRASAREAPIRETLAAALVRFSGWDGRSPLIDPLCGSGTVLLEAGAWAARRAPGLARAQFGFERWLDFEGAQARELADLRAEARAAALPEPPPLYGSDTSPEALEAARDNADRARLPVRLRRMALKDVTPVAGHGALIANPPYGERLERAANFGRDLDDVLRRFSAWDRALIVPERDPSSLRASRWLSVYNGAIPCELRAYDAQGSEPRSSR